MELEKSPLLIADHFHHHLVYRDYIPGKEAIKEVGTSYRKMRKGGYNLLSKVCWPEEGGSGAYFVSFPIEIDP